MEKFLLPLLLGFGVIHFCNPFHEGASGSKDSRTYLALGDSYTIGQSVAEDQRWPLQLADKLKEMDTAIDSVEIIARTGWTTAELQQGIAARGPEGPYDLVSLLIGVNNQYRGLPLETFRKEYRELLEQAIELAGDDTSRVFVLSIPDWGVTPFAAGRDREKIASEIDTYNSEKEEITQEMGVRFFNITDISRLAANDESLVADDGLHPSGRMYRLWVNRIAPAVAEMLEEEEG